MSSAEFPVTPTVLRWAREAAGFSPETVAKKLEAVSKKITVDTLLSWEDGEALPWLTALRKLAEIYKRPMAVFFLDTPPTEAAPPKSFRLLPLAEPRPLSPETRLAVRTARRLYELAGEVSDGLGYEMAAHLPKVTVGDDPVALAAKERERLGASMATQQSFHDGHKALWYWRDLVEAAGCFVFQLGFPIEDARAFSEFFKDGPIIVLSSKEELAVARIFSLFHEYAHLLLRMSGICPDLTVDYVTSPEGKVEQFCNAFAANFLVPAADLKAAAAQIAEPLHEDGIRTLSYRFSVSKHVILRRFLELGWINTATYRSRVAAWAKEPKPKKSDSGGPSQDVKSVMQRGRRLAGLVVEAADRGLLTPPAVVEGLGVRSVFLDDIRRRVAQ